MFTGNRCSFISSGKNHIGLKFVVTGFLHWWEQCIISWCVQVLVFNKGLIRNKTEVGSLPISASSTSNKPYLSFVRTDGTGLASSQMELVSSAKLKAVSRRTSPALQVWPVLAQAVVIDTDTFHLWSAWSICGVPDPSKQFWSTLKFRFHLRLIGP